MQKMLESFVIKGGCFLDVWGLLQGAGKLIPSAISAETYRLGTP